jgi:hypothetical protein
MRMKAFPTLKDNGHITTQDGMDLRDYFAAKAMQAMLASPELLVIVTADEVLGDNSRERCARCAYNFADAMMEARKDD